MSESTEVEGGKATTRRRGLAHVDCIQRPRRRPLVRPLAVTLDPAYLFLGSNCQVTRLAHPPYRTVQPPIARASHQNRRSISRRNGGSSLSTRCSDTKGNHVIA